MIIGRSRGFPRDGKGLTRQEGGLSLCRTHTSGKLETNEVKWMKIWNAILACGLVITLAGCATSSQVQEMIDASQSDFLKKSAGNARSIDVLKQTAKASLEKDSEHAAIMRELKKQLAAATAALESLQATVEATKVMSADSIVKMSELKDAVAGNKSVMGVQIEKMRAIDDLYETVLIGHYQRIADSANAAVASLRADNKPDDAELVIQRDPILLAEPIEIVAPDTSAATNAAPGE